MGQFSMEITCPTGSLLGANQQGLAKPMERSTWLTEMQVVKMIEACNDEMHKGLVTLAVDTGMRKQEILRLHESEVDLDAGTVTMGNTSDLRTKTGRGRVIPLTQRSRDALAKQMQAQKATHSQTHTKTQWTGYVFENPKTGKPITTVKTFWLAMCKRARLEGVRFHDLRHTFATRGLHLGADATSIMAITGHKSAASFKRYTHASDESKMRVINLMQKTHIGHTTPNKIGHTEEDEEKSM
jgi:integrase